MRIHKEGVLSILIAILLVAATLFGAMYTSGIGAIILYVLFAGALVLLGLILWFFRIPNRQTPSGTNKIICPADGKIVVIEKTRLSEFIDEDRIQVSIFMSPLNVHAQWYPINGAVINTAYHPGKHLVAWHPKSSELNERSSVLIQSENGKSLLVRQIAGAVARRIVTYARTNEPAKQGEEMGFIKFGSRVDVFLPVDTKILVDINDVVIGNQTVLAEW